MSRLYIIGNGFDVAHGIPSKYSDFCKYMCLYHHKDFHELGELYNYNNPSILWCDFENRLGCPDICSDVQRRMSFWKRQNNNNGFQQEIEMGNDCDDKVVNLVQYFQDWITDTLSTISCEPKYELNKCDYYLSFNYTSLLEDVYKIPSTHVYHIHHNTGFNNLYKPIVGHGLNKNDVEPFVKKKINDIKNFINSNNLLEKEIIHYYEDLIHSTYKNAEEIWNNEVKSWITSFIKNIDEVYILGHSLSEIDGYYFKTIHESLPCNAKINVSVYLLNEHDSKIQRAQSFFGNRQIKCDVLDNLLQSSQQHHVSSNITQISESQQLSTTKYEKVLILGNGFNIDINLKIDYQDYFKSDYWNCVSDCFCEKSPLINYVKQCIDANRYNIETILGEYVMKLQDSQNKNIDKKAFETLESSFRDFVWYASQNINLNSKGIKVLCDFERENYFGNQNNIYSLYSFNYTYLKDIFQKIYDKENAKNYGLSIITGEIPDVGPLIIDFIHGCASKEGHIILGVDAVNTGNANIDKDYDFLEKQKHPSFIPEKKLYLLKSLSHANEIDFYGFSFSDADRPYFDNFFKMALDGQNTVGEKRKIKIYTKDEDSGKGISDNIQEMTGGNSSFFDMYDLTLCYSNGQSEHVC